MSDSNPNDISCKDAGMSLSAFMNRLDSIVDPIIALSKIKEEHREELKELGILKEDPQPKWKRRTKGEKRLTDKWDYGERI